MTSERLRDIVLGTLRLREWALGVFTTSPAASPPDVPEPSWDGFLQMERCAARLRGRVAEARRLDALPLAGRRTLKRSAIRDTQRDLVARAQLAELSQIASRQGWNLLVLKGGVVPALRADPLDLADLDVLVHEDVGLPLVHALGAIGYDARGPSSSYHLRGLYAKTKLPIEIHIALDDTALSNDRALWSRSIPLSGLPSLARLGPADDVWSLLIHIAVKHPERRGALRDLLLVADSLGRCSDQERESIGQRIQKHEARDPMDQILIVAGFIVRRAPVLDPFRENRAVAIYVTTTASKLRAPHLVRADVGSWTLALLLGGRERRRRWRLIRQVTLEPSFSPAIARIERHSARVGRAVRVLNRLVRTVLAILIAVPLAIRVRRQVDRAMVRLENRDQLAEVPTGKNDANRSESP